MTPEQREEEYVGDCAVGSCHSGQGDEVCALVLREYDIATSNHRWGQTGNVWGADRLCRHAVRRRGDSVVLESDWQRRRQWRRHIR